MRRHGKISTEEKVDLMEKYLRKNKSLSQICAELGISHKTFYKWLSNYQKDGVNGLIVNKKNKYYSQETKLSAIQDYLSGCGSYESLCKKHNITDTRVLRGWVKKYNGNEIAKSHLRGNNTMTKGRTTSYEERVQIVAFCIANNDNYQLTAEKFLVSYQQVYTWVKKYKEKGHESLLDRRGKRRSFKELNESEKTMARLKLLEAENKRLKMENDFLKKLGLVERRRR